VWVVGSTNKKNKSIDLCFNRHPRECQYESLPKKAAGGADGARSLTPSTASIIIKDLIL
jgi:hypothetical protein